MSQADDANSRASPRDVMQRVTFRVGDDRLGEVDQLVEDGRYANRSEVLRAAVDELVGGDES